MGWLEAGVYPGGVGRIMPSTGRRHGLTITFVVVDRDIKADVHIPFARIAELMAALGAVSLDRLTGRGVDLTFDRTGALVAVSTPNGTYQI